MSEDYRKMWQELGLDLPAHDALLAALGQTYVATFLNQKDRPAGMGYFDSLIGEAHGRRIRELREAQAAGRKVVASFCLFFPEELALALEAVSVGICTGAALATEQAEQFLPRNTCDLIKSMFGFKLARVCPYMETADLIVGENTCDGKKKGYEQFATLVKNFFALDLPQTRSEAGRALLRSEYARLLRQLEKLTGKNITADALREGIRLANRKREAQNRLDRARAAVPAPISGLDALLISQLSFFDEPSRFAGGVHKLCEELEERGRTGRGVHAGRKPRVVVSGCPMAVPNWKLPAIIEGAGGVVVAEESCVGSRGFRRLTDEGGGTVDELLDRVVDRYLAIDCAIFTPNRSRVERVQDLVSSQRADGVIHYALQFCQPYSIESIGLEAELQKAGIPVLRIETDYRQEDAPLLKTRVEAFLEMLK